MDKLAEHRNLKAEFRLRLRQELKDTLERIAKRRGIRLSDYTREVLAAAAKREGGK